MINVKDEGIILEKTGAEFESHAVLNPACVEIDGVTHMLYRAVRSGDFVSSIGHCILDGGKDIKRFDKPVLYPEFDYEKHGVEDPRIVLFEGMYYIFYTAYDGVNALIAYATSPDLVTFQKHGVISPTISYKEAARIFCRPNVREKYFLFDAYTRDRAGEDILLWEKDAFIFPKRINGKIALVHRIMPGIQVIYFDDFKDLTNEYWRNYLKNLAKHIMFDPYFVFESRNIGGGCPPIETKYGWLLIYHAVEDSLNGSIYHAGAALLDLNDPAKLIGRLSYPLFSPKETWERKGTVNNVVFPSGAVQKDGRLYIYYGAADELIAAKSLDIEELLKELRKK
jgi:beta-1,2-mannobiose phosphorylase / 1,2-beta-oligomannan phosphorylase